MDRACHKQQKNNTSLSHPLVVFVLCTLAAFGSMQMLVEPVTRIETPALSSLVLLSMFVCVSLVDMSSFPFGYPGAPFLLSDSLRELLPGSSSLGGRATLLVFPLEPCCIFDPRSCWGLRHISQSWRGNHRCSAVLAGGSHLSRRILSNPTDARNWNARCLFAFGTK